MLRRLTQTGGRQREIAEVVLGYGWDYMRNVLQGGKTQEPNLPTPQVLRNILTDLGPVYVKLGQLLSTRPDLLPARYIHALSDLQANVPSVPWSEVVVVLKQSLPRALNSVFESIEEQPVAAGSIAQTHRAVLRSGEVVAVKVQRPGIEQLVKQDSALIRAIAELASLTAIGQDYDLVALAEEFIQALQAELDFTQEAKYTDQLRTNLNESTFFKPEDIVVPRVHWELTTPKVMVMSWLTGKPILTAQRQGSDRDLTRLLLQAFVQQIYLDGFFHADPHPGNLFYLDDGRLALLDCGMMGHLDPGTQEVLAELLLAIISVDAQRCASLTLQLAESARPDNLAALERDLNRLLRQYYSRNLADVNFSLVFYEILQVARTNRVRLPGNMGLFAKTLANLEGVVRTLDPEINVMGELQPLMINLFQRRLTTENWGQLSLQTAIDLRRLSLRSPRHLEQILDRFTSETLRWQIKLVDIEGLRRSLDDSATRLSFSIVVGAMIIGAASISPLWVSNLMFGLASLLGLWLIISILRSGRLR